MSETIAKAKNQLEEFWQGMDKSKKIKLIVGSLVIIILLTGVIYFLTRTEYEVLYTDLSLKDAGLITEKLDEMSVPWENGENNDERTIRVPVEMKNKVKIQLATQGLPKEGYSVLDAFEDSSWTMTEYEKRERVKFGLQNELASTISEIDGIDSATVYIDIPNDDNFLDRDSKATASVFLNLYDESPINQESAKAIRNLVSSAFKKMNAEDVNITDNYGRSYNEENVYNGYDIDNQLNIKQAFENKMNASVKRFLENIFGYGNVDVRTNAIFDFDTEVTNQTLFAPPVEGNDEGLIRSMEQVEEHSVNGTSGAVPGTESNTNDQVDYGTVDGGNSKYDKASKIINYELNEINRQINKSPGKVKDLSVAILINQDALSDGELTDEKRKEISELVESATGTDVKNVTVTAGKFNISIPGSSVGGDTEKSGVNMMIIIGALIGLALIVIIGIIIYRRRKINEEEELQRMLGEKSIESDEVEEINFDKEKSGYKSQVDNFVDKKPETVAQLLRSWINEE
ncbi:flagellar basal-body MS-ring/collar protein FliF [Clostridiisalibacter paucivorans]|uniref:flagellar basal-body MS-ring/collar protein FliF n=1 Tax=Clostridiisalibacter paucivorans TaxID=408753 RepID=UPI0004795477|nr:flagellar basal-body MS-ring/collar protein FliF [Clostridiisalibacter paucivorans]